MRIISGNLRGAKLYMTKGKVTRPLKDLVRENIFNLLSHSKKISFKLENSNVLDLYSGTGSFGLECLSREANKVYFVENEKYAFEILKKNIEKLKLIKKTKNIFSDVMRLVEKENISKSKFDIIFCDPPFKMINLSKLIDLISNKKLLSKSGIIILHRHKNTKDKMPNYFKVVEEKIYGVSKITFGKFLS